MKKITLFLLAFILLFSLMSCGQKVPTWQEQYDLGVKYLSEGNYEDAIIAFTAAIEIDERNANTYVFLARAYLESGDSTSAAVSLEKWYDLMEDQGIELINEFLSQHQEILMAEEVVTTSDFMVNHCPITSCTLLDFQYAYPSTLDENWYYESLQEMEYHGETGIKYRPRVKTADNGYADWGVWAWAPSESAPVSIAVFDNDLYQAAFDFCGVTFGDSVSTVLSKIGITSLGIKYLDAIGGMPRICIFKDGSREIDTVDLPEHYQSSNTAEVNIWDNQQNNCLMLQFENDTLTNVQYSLLS